MRVGRGIKSPPFFFRFGEMKRILFPFFSNPVGKEATLAVRIEKRSWLHGVHH